MNTSGTKPDETANGEYGVTPSGALESLRVVELGGIGPAPFAGMLLADMGADVIRIDRLNSDYGDLLMRGKRSIRLNLNSEGGREIMKLLIAWADILIEGFRPGVLERLRFSPIECWEINPKLVIGRMTGWGQEGPLSQAAGHDLNYLGLNGVLNSIGASESPPSIPLNLVGDYGGGGAFLAFGSLCAFFEASKSGYGQVVDAAMVDGSAILMTKWFGELAKGKWNDGRGENAVDGGSHFYNVYETSDGKYVTVGAIEDKFYDRLTEMLGISSDEAPNRRDPECWAPMKERFASIFLSRTRNEWVDFFAGEEVCVGPVLSMNEAIQHPHNQARSTFVEIDGVVQPAPAPRLQRTPGHSGRVPKSGEHTLDVLRQLGVEEDALGALQSQGVIE